MAGVGSDEGPVLEQRTQVYHQVKTFHAATSRTVNGSAGCVALTPVLLFQENKMFPGEPEG